jgi:hypothetical protein
MEPDCTPVGRLVVSNKVQTVSGIPLFSFSGEGNIVLLPQEKSLLQRLLRLFPR